MKRAFWWLVFSAVLWVVHCGHLTMAELRRSPR